MKAFNTTSFDELCAWAMSEVNADLNSVKRQITEYGSIDLEIMGRGLQEMSGIPVTMDAAVGQEMAVIFYILGKVSRGISAIAAGQMPSEDSLRDITVYSLMLRHVRQFGHWKIEGTTDAAETGS